MLKPGDYLRPTGGLIVGNGLDCNKAFLERILKAYDKQLYIKWNPKKRGGWGMWEVRRKPDTLTNVYHGEFNGAKLYTAEYVEIDIVNHVLDVEVLHENILGKIKQMDTWGKKNYIDELDSAAAKYKQEEEVKARAEMRYNAKQHKREWKEFAALVAQGVNPSHILKGMRG